MEIKVTVLIILIAIVLYEILKGEYKEVIKNYIVSILLIGILSVLFSFVEGKILWDKEMTNRSRVPIEHWIMIGLEGTGTYNQEDIEYTLGYGTYEEKKTADREMIISRIKNYTPITFIRHLNDKLKFAWTDGTYFAIAKVGNGVVDKNIWNQVIISEESGIYKYLPQITHIAMIFLVLIHVCNIIKKKDLRNRNIILILATLGILVFLLIWENRSRYLFTMVPVLMLLQLDGVERLEQMTNKTFTIMHRKKNKE